MGDFSSHRLAERDALSRIIHSSFNQLKRQRRHGEKLSCAEMSTSSSTSTHTTTTRQTSHQEKTGKTVHVQYHKDQAVQLQYANTAAIAPPGVTVAPGVTVLSHTPQLPPAPTSTFFRKDLFACFDNVGLCLCVTFVPFASCYVSNKVAETVGETFCCHGCCACCDPIHSRVRIRGMLRAKHGIQGDCFGDSVVHMFCGPCAIVQEVNEVVDRGVAPDMPCMPRK